MGFRSTFISNDYSESFPDWFVEKYKDKIHFNRRDGKNCLPVSSVKEGKEYAEWNVMLDDLRQVMTEDWKFVKQIIIVFLHECGGITRVKITPEKITYSEPENWKKTEGVTHSYCYGCSDIE